MASNGISFSELRQSQDNCSLERNAAKDTAIMETLSSDGNCPNLAHLDTTVGHLLVGHGGHLQTQLFDQLEVHEGGVRCGVVG